MDRRRVWSSGIYAEEVILEAVQLESLLEEHHGLTMHVGNHELSICAYLEKSGIRPEQLEP